MLEPGRSIVGSSGITLYTVGSIKEIPNIRTYVAVDGGMTDNPRYALYQSEYEAVVANKADQPKTMKVTLAGKCCESGDLLGENMPIQQGESGDLVVTCWRYLPPVLTITPWRPIITVFAVQQW